MVTNKFFNIVNNKYKQVSKSVLAKSIFKNSIDIGTAVVNVIGGTGIAGFKFNCPQREEIELENESTDNYLDSNEPVQDHIARKPVIITLQGLQGDYFYSANQIEDIIAQVTPALSLVKNFIPVLTNAAQQIKALKTFKSANLYSVADGMLMTTVESNNLNYTDLFQVFQNLYKITSAQSRAYFFFEALWKSKARITIETTWKSFDNMVLQSVKPIRDDNADITDFKATFKQMNFASTTVINLNNKAGRTRQQLAKRVKKGLDRGLKVNTI